jgi:hypothetical protein
MTLFVKSIPVALAALLGAVAAFPGAQEAPAAGKFDGSWSVVVITEQGSCDRAYRYPLKVVNGTIKYLNDAGIEINGRVDGRGHIKASIRRGQQYAEGSGRLGEGSGIGTWSGKDHTGECTGRWEAERRDS